MSTGKDQAGRRQDIPAARLQELHEVTLHLFALLASRTLEKDLLQNGIDALTGLIEAHYGAIGLTDETGKLVQFIHSGITPQQAELIGKLPQGHGLLGVAIHDGQSLRLDDISKDPRSQGFPPNHPPMKSLLAVPIAHEGRIFGQIYLSDKFDGTPFHDSDEALAHHYADALAFMLAYYRARAEREHERESLHQIAQALSSITGEVFFRELALILTKALQVDYAFIGELDRQGAQTIHTAAVCAHGKILDNITYTLRGTPCENVVGQRFCIYPNRVQQQFPQDKPLQEMGVESYMGAPLFDSAGKPIGLIALLHSKPLADHRQAEAILTISAARAAAELERRRTEETMRENEENLRALAENANDGILVNCGGKHVFANQRLADMLGYSLEELRATGIRDLVHPDEYEKVAGRFRERMTGKAVTSQYETVFVSKSGAALPVEISATKTVWQGQPAGLVFIRDISARKQAEAEERKLSSVVEQTADSVVITDRGGVIQYVNEAYEATTGYTRKEAVGKSPSIVKSGKHDKAFYERLWSTISRGEVFRERFINRRKNGALYYEEKTITPLKNDKGDITHFVSTGKDITARMLAENENRRMQAFLNSVVENLPNMLIVKDAKDLQFVRFNKAAEELLGFSRDEMLGKGDYDFFTKEEADFFTAKDREVLDSRQPHDIPEEPIHTKHKGMRLLHTQKIPILDEAGKPLYLLGLSEDITERKKTDEALRASEVSLANAQRIAHLGNWSWDLVTGELRWSDEVYHIFGLKPRQSRLTAETFLNAVHPDDRTSVTETANQAIVEKLPFDLDFRIIRPNGVERIVHEQAEVTFDENGKPIRMVGTIQDITNSRRTQERLNYLAYYDTLTGLPNRVLLQDRLHQAMLEAHRRDRLVAVMFLDLDRFKIINDTLGHDVGDVLLKEVAGRLTACVRAGDTISRLGGDEFTVILDNVAHVDDVSRVAQKIIDSFIPPFQIAGREMFMSTSIGITLCPLDDSSIENLMRNADAAMYHAKEMGRNTFQFYTAELNRRTAKRLQLETALRHALERHELLLHYQPQVNIKTGKIIGMEALLRWQHPEMGLIPPLDFIPLAEETGLIIPIGEWVLRTACRQAQAWRQAGIRGFQVAVNLSGRQFQHRNLAKLVKNVLKETGLDPRHLDLELTESILMHNIEATLATMNELHVLGVAFSMDDFGTGYSSLSYLKRFPIDTLKIDRSFVRDITSDPDDAAISQAIIAMSHSLGARVIAEGVETAKQLAFLRAHRCDAMQGYYFSKPVPAEDMSQLLLKDSRLAVRKSSKPGKRAKKRTVK